MKKVGHSQQTMNEAYQAHEDRLAVGARQPNYHPDQIRSEVKIFEDKVEVSPHGDEGVNLKYEAKRSDAIEERLADCAS